jgi:PAS domain S-box-containing protein
MVGNSGIAAHCVLFYSDRPVVNHGTISRPEDTLASATHSLASVGIIEQLFDHIPDTVFFLKDMAGRYVAVNQSLVERCGLTDKQQLIGKRVHDVFPPELAKRYAAQDTTVVRTGRPIVDRLELHWYARRRAGWCLTTKLPLRDQRGNIIGSVGISRDLRAPGDRDSIPATLASTLEFLEAHFGDNVSPAVLAQRAGLSPVRFARIIKRIFRLTPTQLITQTRLAAASRLLTETNQHVVEIAHACGFYDHSAFTRAFRSATGMTPTQFRAAR